VALITPGWSAKTLKQVLGRIHRAGGTRAQQYFVLVAKTAEERVAKAIQRKLKNLEALNDDDIQ
jgi:superfamily II DNA or RNA helicase